MRPQIVSVHELWFSSAGRLQLNPTSVITKVALQTDPTKKVLSMSTAKATCAIAHKRFRSSHWNGIVGNLRDSRSSVDSDQESAYVPCAFAKRDRLSRLGEEPLPAIGTSDVTRNGITMEQKKEKQE